MGSWLRSSAPVSGAAPLHFFAMHLVEDGYDVRTVQELRGQRGPKYDHGLQAVLNRSSGRGVRSRPQGPFRLVRTLLGSGLRSLSPRRLGYRQSPELRWPLSIGLSK